MKKLLLVGLMFLTSCSDRYDFVRQLEYELPGVNIEAFKDSVYVATYENKSILIHYGKGYALKMINSIPEQPISHIGNKEDLIKALREDFKLIEK